MMKKKRYHQTRFTAEAIRQASAVFDHQANPTGNKRVRLSLKVEVNDEEWHHESESEFFADYRRASSASFQKDLEDAAFKVYQIRLDVSESAVVEVTAATRSQIEAVFEVFEEQLSSSRLPDPPTPPPPRAVVFIGHGQSRLWRDLKDHLQDKHAYRVEAYEIGARAGHAVRNVLEDLLKKSSLALLVMTSEDETVQGDKRARQNVIHEIGLFQGRLGFTRAIVLLEEGTEEFSNIQGIEQIRFSRGNIRESFGDVLATIKREFPENEPDEIEAVEEG